MTPLDYSNLNATLVNKLKKKIEELNEAKEKYKTIIENTTDIIYSYLPDGTINYISPGVAKFGYAPGEIIGHNMIEFVHPDDRKFILSETKRSLETGSESPTIARIIKKDGSSVWVEETSKMVQENGQIIKLNGIIRDITERKQAEEKIKESEEKYSTLVEKGNDGIVIIQDGLLKFTNGTMSKLLGYSADNIINKRFTDFIQINFRKPTLEHYKERMHGKNVTDRYEIVLITKKGKPVPVEISASMIRYMGKPADMAIIRDITERKKAEAKVIENEAKFRAIFEGATDGILVADAKTKKFMFANPSICRITGYSEKELIGLGVNRIHPKKDLPYVLGQFKKQMQGKITLAENIPVLMKNKTVMYCDINSAAAIIGNIRVLIGFFRDITDKKKAEEAIKESEKKYRALINTTGTGYVILDSKGIVLDANQEYVRLTGRKNLSEIKGRSVMEWTAKHDLKRNIQEVIKCFKKGFVRDLNVDYVDKKGKITPIEVNATVIDSKQGKIVVTLCRDVSERKKVEMKLKQSEEKFRILYETSADAIMTLEPPTWRFTSGNPATVKMFGAKNEKEFTSKGPYDLSPNCQPDGQLSGVKAKKMIMKAMKTGSNFFEWTHKRLNGEDFPATVLLTRVTIGGKTFLQATVRDITKQKMLENKIKKIRHQTHQARGNS